MKVLILNVLFLERIYFRLTNLCYRFELLVIAKALTLRGLAHSFLLRASAAAFAFLRMCCHVLCSFSHELPVVERCKLSSSPSASIMRGVIINHDVFRPLSNTKIIALQSFYINS
ncbi:hypothetical protein Tco_0056131 [Tanacetum coccineum]